MKIKPFKLGLCRTPTFCLNDMLKDRWEDLKEKIKHASPTFFNMIESVKAGEIDLLDEKTKYTIWKYFNRSIYRATPFNDFACITKTPVLHQHVSTITIEKEAVLHHFIDWKKNGFSLQGNVLEYTKLLHTNTSVYYLGKEVRYIRHAGESFEMAAIPSFLQLDTVLNTCRYKASRDQVYGLLRQKFQMVQSDIEDLIKQMIGLQLLYTDRHPNITGEDFFTRLGYVNQPKQKGEYVIAERKLMQGGIDQHDLKGFPQMIQFLSICLPDSKNEALDHFRVDFIRKFEQREVPLGIALDPEIGVGYGDFDHPIAESILVEELKEMASKDTSESDLAYTPLHRFLIDGMAQGGNIQLDEFEPTNGPTAYTLPNTFIALYTKWQGKPVLEHLGGVTANSLLGRFTLMDHALEDMGRQIVETEARANPDILFFDISYQAEKEIDNVNRRKALYNYELPVSGWSCTPEPLNVQDILVSVEGEEIILKSRKHGKRMIPRLASAYNYTRSDLAVYRFLCDVQGQGLKTNLTFQWQNLLPHLDHYPRVCYKQVVLSPAMWKVPEAIYGQGQTLQHMLQLLRAWLSKKNICFKFKAGHADRMLCFDPRQGVDLLSFAHYCRQVQQPPIYISEALISGEGDVRDEKNNQYIAQYLVNFYHESPIYAPKIPGKREPKTIKTIFLPGEEWLYLEIYVHPIRSNVVLLNHIKPLLKKSGRYCHKWFFVRYDEPSSHIRLRLHLKDPSYGLEILKKMKKAIKKDVKKRLISDYAVKTYMREVERYGATRMDMVEQFFGMDSEFVLSLLSKKMSVEQLYCCSLNLILDWMALCFADEEEALRFAKRSAHYFALEKQLDGAAFKSINRSYEQLQQELPLIPDLAPTQKQRKCLKKLLPQCEGEEGQTLLANLIHMHLNRLFPSDQRYHETLIYHYLVRMLRTRRALANHRGQ